MTENAQADELLWRGIAAAKAGRKEHARQILMSVVELDERNELAWLWLSGAVDSLENRRVCIENVLAINPDNASALNYVGYTWAERGIRLDEAETMIIRAIELRPDDGYIADSLGWVYYMRARPLVESGRREEAQEYIDRALRELKRAAELTGGDPVISEHLGDTYLLLNRKRHALEQFEEALRLEPREGEQPDLLEKLETLQRELE